MSPLLPIVRDGAVTVPLVALVLASARSFEAAGGALAAGALTWLSLALGAWLMGHIAARMAAGRGLGLFGLALACKPVVLLGAFVALMASVDPVGVAAGLAAVVLGFSLRPLLISFGQLNLRQLTEQGLAASSAAPAAQES